MAPGASQEDPDTRVTGSVERCVYHDARTRYTVVRLRVPGELSLVTAVGRSSGMDDGMDVTLHGEWTTHKTHGRQFAFDRVELSVPTSLEGIRRRLARYPGIKDVMADRIVRRFGLDALDIVDRTPRRLAEVEGIGPKTVERIVAHHQTQHGPVAKLEGRLVELDLPPHLAGLIHDKYGDEAISVLTTRPYRLARDVRGIGFTTADGLARAHGVPLDSDERVEAGIIHALERAENDGHCALPAPHLVEAATRLLSVDADRVGQALARLELDGDVVSEDHGESGTLVFPHLLYMAERDVADRLAMLVAQEAKAWVLQDLAEELSDGQRAAVTAVGRTRVVVLTGGPGTGKSTVVRNVLEAASHNGTRVHLCAPTGRAAKRLERTTGQSASTLHRLLEFQPDSGAFTFGPGNPLPEGLVVVDEASMLDLQLTKTLLDALSPEHRLLLVGDVDQLPSVGAGNVLRDIIAAGEADGSGIEVVRLTHVFRQAQGSSIVRNAHRILAGERPQADPPGSDGQFFVIHARSPEHAHQVAVRTMTERIPEAYGLNAQTDVQLLTPMHKGLVGTEAFNRALQEVHTSSAKGVEVPGRMARVFRVGDRVMQTRNDYERGVFNGDVGVVISADEDERRLVVEIDGMPVKYEPKDLLSLTLAWAASIHKSQGSEFPAVVVTLMPEHHVMLRRNLLYTAITRAKVLCVLIGDRHAIERAVRRADAARRNTGLRARLQAVLGVGPHWSADTSPGG